MSIDLTPFNYGAIAVRVVTIDSEPWFVLADLCKVLAISDVSIVRRRLDDALCQTHPIADSLGRTQQATIVSEPGMYEVVIRSDKPEAVAFRHWITGTVLPEIRRTGGFGGVERLTPLEYARKLVDAEERAEAGEQFKRAIEGGDGLTLTAFHKKYFSAVREIDFFTHLYTRKWLINQRGKGSVRRTGPRAGTRRDGGEHRHPTFKGKPYMYLHGAKDQDDRRRENTRVRPGAYELQLRDRLMDEGLLANENSTGLFELEGAR